MQALLMFVNSLEMMKIERKVSELSQIVCKKYNFEISSLVGYIVWIIWWSLLVFIHV